jgi:hypothetical protein
VDPLGVVRERLCGQLPDDGAGVGGHASDELVDAVGISLIHQQADREWELCWPRRWVLAAGTKVVVVDDGGEVCRVIDGRGLRVWISSTGLRRLS